MKCDEGESSDINQTEDSAFLVVFKAKESIVGDGKTNKTLDLDDKYKDKFKRLHEEAYFDQLNTIGYNITSNYFQSNTQKLPTGTVFDNFKIDFEKVAKADIRKKMEKNIFSYTFEYDKDDILK